MAGKTKRRTSGTGAEGRLPVVHARPSGVTDGPALLSADAGRGPARTSAPSNAGRPASEAGGRETSDEGRRGEAGGPGEREGGRPTCGSHTDAEGVDQLSTDHPHTYFPVTPPEDPQISHTRLEFVAEDPEALPTTGLRRSAVPSGHGKDANGKNIPLEYHPAVARKIAEWVALGATENDIALFLHCRPGQLKDVYLHELRTGKFQNDMAVGSSILNLAKAGVPQMAIFYAKARMGWSDKDKSDLDGDGLLNIHIHT